MTTHASDDQLSRLLDGDLGLQARATVLAHLDDCPACAARHEDLVEAVALLRASPAVRFDDALLGATMQRLPRARVGRLRDPVGAALVTLIGLVGAFAGVVLTPFGLALGGAMFQGVQALAPPGVASARDAVTALALLAVLAPVLAYPLARWR